MTKHEQDQTELGSEHFYQGESYLQQGDKERALQHFLKATRCKCPELDVAYSRCGDIYLDQHELDLAKTAFTKSLRYKPNAHILFKLGKIRFLQGKLIKALHCLNQTLTLDPNNINADYQRTKIKFYQNQYHPNNFSKNTIVRNPKSADIHLLNGEYYLYHHNPTLAYTQLKKAIELDPYLYLADVLFAKVNYRFDQEKEVRLHLLKAWEYADPLTKLYSGIQLHKLTNIKLDLEPVIKEICESHKESPQRSSLLAIAFDFLNDSKLARAYAKVFFRDYQPNTIPPYLRIEFLTAITNPNVWQNEAFEWNMKKPAETKDQLLDIINHLYNDNFKQNLLWQALSNKTLIGSIFHIKRKWLKSPSLKSGRLNIAATQLEKLIKQTGQVSMDKTTYQFLIDDKNLQKELKNYFPILHAVLGKYQKLSDSVSRQGLFANTPASSVKVEKNPLTQVESPTNYVLN